MSDSRHRIPLSIIFISVVAAGIALIIIPPALFPDPANGLQVLRSMNMGSPFNTFTAPDQSDISQNYDEFLTWWSPGQYLIPHVLSLIFRVSIGRALSLTVALGTLTGLAGFYSFFKKIGFTPLISAISLVFIMCQLAFFVPFVFYNGGEILLFAFEGWFLYGCIALKKPGIQLVLFVLFSGLTGFFCKSSFLWIYSAGLGCLWVQLCLHKEDVKGWIKKAVWIGIPAVISVALIYINYISKGRSPAGTSTGLKLTAETFAFPLASPLLSGFSLDDLFHGLLYNFGKPMFEHGASILILLILALAGMALVLHVIRFAPNNNYKWFVIIFYLVSFLFFGLSYLRQLNISYEGRHFRIIGLLITPGIIYVISNLKRSYQVLFTLFCLCIFGYGINYMFKGLQINNSVCAKGKTGIAQINIDQQSLDQVIKLDETNQNATFVFVNNDIGLEIMHNRIINLAPVASDLKIDMDDYCYKGHAGPLYIILPETYNGPREKMIMKSFPGYKGFNLSMLSDKYVLYSAK